MKFEEIQQTIFSIFVALVLFILLALVFGGPGHKFLALLMIMAAAILIGWLVAKGRKMPASNVALIKRKTIDHQRDIDEAVNTAEMQIDNIWQEFWRTLREQTTAAIKIENMQILQEIQWSAEKLYAATASKTRSHDGMTRSPLENGIRREELRKDFYKVAKEARDLEDDYYLGRSAREWMEMLRDLEADAEFRPKAILKELDTHQSITEGIIQRKHTTLEAIANNQRLSEEARQELEVSTKASFDAELEVLNNQKADIIKRLETELDQIKDKSKEAEDILDKLRDSMRKSKNA